MEKENNKTASSEEKYKGFCGMCHTHILCAETELVEPDITQKPLQNVYTICPVCGLYVPVCEV